jgi:hypothetical protein
MKPENILRATSSNAGTGPIHPFGNVKGSVGTVLVMIEPTPQSFQRPGRGQLGIVQDKSPPGAKSMH